jgi:hypothetical protein
MATAEKVVGATAYRLDNDKVKVEFDDGGVEVLTEEEALARIGKTNYDKLNELHKQSGRHLEFDTVLDAYNHPDMRNNMLNMFTEQSTIFKKGSKYYGYDNACIDVPDAILNYPKIIYEPSFLVERGVIGTAFASVDEVRLPFPKITVLTCMGSVLLSMSGEPFKVKGLTPIYLSQGNGFIRAYFVTNKRGAETLMFNIVPRPIGGTVVHNGISQMPVDIGLDEEQQKFWKTDTEQGNKFIQQLARTVLYITVRVVYMTTFSGGEFYVSKPTKNEIAVNAKRIRKGKKPLVEFRMIVIDGKTPSLPTAPHSTHASPRLHWRRGHWRTMKKSGKKVWVDPMLVGNEENGKIIKDYAVGKYDETTKKSI